MIERVATGGRGGLSPRATLALTLLAALSLGACAAQRKLIYTPAELRAELTARAPWIAPADQIIPHAVGPEEIATARAVVMPFDPPHARAAALRDALFSPSRLGIAYDEHAVGTAAETLRLRRGNCLSLAALYVGLGRAVGVPAFFLDASERIEEVTRRREVVVRSGHITAAALVESGVAVLDLGRSIDGLVAYRILSDLEATAHFYNNRGAQRISAARLAGGEPDWDAVLADLSAAVALAPGFARALSNLGVAHLQRGELDQAQAALEAAAAADPTLASPHYNLGVLALRRGAPQAALEALEVAASRDGRAAHVHVLRGLALERLGRLVEARAAYELALALDLQDGAAAEGRARVERALAKP